MILATTAFIKLMVYEMGRRLLSRARQCLAWRKAHLLAAMVATTRLRRHQMHMAMSSLWELPMTLIITNPAPSSQRSATIQAHRTKTFTSMLQTQHTTMWKAMSSTDNTCLALFPAATLWAISVPMAHILMLPMPALATILPALVFLMSTQPAISKKRACHQTLKSGRRLPEW